MINQEHRQQHRQPARQVLEFKLTFRSLYGEREPEVYERDKFRPENINKYGNEIQTISVSEVSDEQCAQKIMCCVTKNQSITVPSYEDISDSDEKVEENLAKMNEASLLKKVYAVKTKRKAARITQRKNKYLGQLEEEEKRSAARAAVRGQTK